MSLQTSITLIVKKINGLHPEDPKVYECWGELTELLSRDESSTISLLNGLNDVDVIEDLSSVFDDVAKNLQSKEFIVCIESLQKKHPDLMLEHMVQAAKDTLID